MNVVGRKVPPLQRLQYLKRCDFDRRWSGGVSEKEVDIREQKASRGTAYLRPHGRQGRQSDGPICHAVTSVGDFEAVATQPCTH